MTENLNDKLEKLDRKVERLKKERNKLLYSNMALVKLLTEMGEFLEHEIRIGKINKSELAADNSLESSQKLDIQEIESQVEAIENEIKRLEK
jgi:archaellum component FlaC